MAGKDRSWYRRPGPPTALNVHEPRQHWVRMPPLPQYLGVAESKSEETRRLQFPCRAWLLLRAKTIGSVFSSPTVSFLPPIDLQGRKSPSLPIESCRLQR